MTISTSAQEELAAGTVEEMRNAPGMNYVSIVLLRELQSYAQFTTDGEDADFATVRVAHNGDSTAYTPAVVFNRKQSGAERRTGKAMMRDFLGLEDTMDVGEMNPRTMESVLLGSAANNSDVSVSVTSRINYDTGYTVRSDPTEEKFQNAPGDDHAKSATSSIREPDFFEPGTLIPSVVTLQDATIDELIFVLAVLRRTKRYGASTSRFGQVNNRLVDIYAGSEEAPSNLDLTRGVIKRFAATDGFDGVGDVVTSKSPLPPEQAEEHLSEVCRNIVETVPLDLQALSDETVEELLEATTGETLQPLLERQQETSEAFLERIIEEDS
jgi:CRISPR-associated protein Csc2